MVSSQLPVRQAFHVVACMLTLSALLGVSNGLLPTKRDQLERVVRQLMRCGNIPGLGISVVNLEDRSLHVNAYGTAEPGTTKRADVNTRFCLGGATQGFTAVLLAKLLHQNPNVTWSTPIQDIIGKRVVLPDAYRSANLNLMDILSQRSGLPAMDIVSVTRPYSASNLVRKLRYVRPVAGFREKYVPNEVLFSLLDSVLLALGGDTWENLLQQHVLKPLGMNSALFLGKRHSSTIDDVAYPVVFFDRNAQSLSLDSLKGLDLTKSANALCLSTSDLSVWTRFLLNDRGASSKQIMDREALEEIFKGVQPRGHGTDDPVISGYRQPDVQVSYAREQNALGWITGHYRGYEFISQDGSIPGYQSLASIFPTRNVAVFTTFTGDGGSRAFAAKVLLNIYGVDLMMRGNTWFDHTDVCDRLEEMMDMHPDEPAPRRRDVIRKPRYMGYRSLHDYVGYYRNHSYGDVVIKHNETEGNDLLMEYGQALYTMTPTNTNDTFQLIAKGLLWYTTNADIYRRNKLIAVFSAEGMDEERPITTLTVSGFDKNGQDVTFDTNPVTPHYEASHDSAYCTASITFSTMPLLILLVLSAILFR